MIDEITSLKEKLEIACFNCEQAESQGRKINEMYGQCLMENNLLKDRIAELEKEKTVSDRALENTINNLCDFLNSIGTVVLDRKVMLEESRRIAKQELEKEENK